MTLSSDVPAYNLKAVVRETGLRPDTIRAWERRYGVPQPKRTKGGHRMYSQHDVDLLKWMNARQHEGMSISRIVDLWKNLEAEGSDPLRVTAPGVIVKTIQLGEAGELADARREWVSACLQFDEPRAEQAATQAFALFPPESVVQDVLLRGLSEIGEGWYRGEAAVQQEHFASTLAARRVQAMIAAGPMPTRAERIVVTCPPEEQHTLSLQAVNLSLRRRGWEVVELGANVPLDRLEPILTALHPQLVIASAQQLPTAQTLQSMASHVIKLHIPFAFGGRVFNEHPGLQRHIAGHFLGANLVEVPRVVQEILHAPWPLPEGIDTSQVYLAALDLYREQLPSIEADVLRALDPKVYEMMQQAGANGFFAQYIMASLALGDMNLLDVDLKWLSGSLSTHHLTDEALRAYLRVYLAALQKRLDRRAPMIVAWLEQAIER